MNDKDKALVRLLTDETVKAFASFLFENIEAETNMERLLNIIISSYFSSMVTSIKFISSQDKKVEKNVDRFIKKLKNFLGNSPILDGFEHMH